MGFPAEATGSSHVGSPMGSPVGGHVLQPCLSGPAALPPEATSQSSLPSCSVALCHLPYHMPRWNGESDMGAAPTPHPQTGWPCQMSPFLRASRRERWSQAAFSILILSVSPGPQEACVSPLCAGPQEVCVSPLCAGPVLALREHKAFASQSSGPCSGDVPGTTVWFWSPPWGRETKPRLPRDELMEAA